MKMDQLGQLLEVVQCGSINKAAQKLFISQSALSNSIKMLEKELGDNIFDRNSKGISLTPFGRDIYMHTKMIWEQVNLLQSISAAPRTELQALTVSNMYSPLANEVFLTLYEKYCDEENVKFSINECSTVDIISQVESGLSEIGIVTLFSNVFPIYAHLIENHDLIFHKLVNKKLYVVVGPKNPFYTTTKKSITTEEMDDFAFSTHYGAINESVWSNLFSGRKRRKKDVSISTLESLTSLLYRTDAFSIDVSDTFDYDMDTNYNALRFIPLEHEDLHCSFGWIAKKERNLSPLAQEYIHSLEEKVLAKKA